MQLTYAMYALYICWLIPGANGGRTLTPSTQEKRCSIAFAEITIKNATRMCVD